PPFYFRPFFDPSAPVSTHFNHQTGAHGWGNNEAQNYTPSAQNSFHSPANALVLRAIADSAAPEGRKYTSARLNTHATLGRDRGYLETRVTAPSARGVWPALWLLPREPFSWPRDGEIDVFESWMGDGINHSCLHWGHFNGEDWDKHRVAETRVGDVDNPAGHVFGLAWEQQQCPGDGGRLVWYIDGRPVMRAQIPGGMRRLSEFQVIINVAMGGNVCQGVLPNDGVYEMVIHTLKLCEEPVGGWGAFEGHWASAPDGKTM
ncbi:glycoside hydrolase family 16 protein, partial [Saccharata proteae CBS 121410]